MLNWSLRHPKRKAAVDRGAHWNLVQQAAVDADDRDGSKIAATVDCLPQDVRAVRSHEGRDLDPVDDGIEARADIRFSANSINAGIRAPAIS
jgi:hypothetical protein